MVAVFEEKLSTHYIYIEVTIMVGVCVCVLVFHKNMGWESHILEFWSIFFHRIDYMNVITEEVCS
jgi:hypothetical protein